MLLIFLLYHFQVKFQTAGL